MKVAVLLLALSLSAFAQSNPCPDRTDLQEEMKETKALVARMQARVITMRNSAGTVRDFEVRNALQVNADGWQDLLDTLKLRVNHMQSSLDRCEAREKIESAKPK